MSDFGPEDIIRPRPTFHAPLGGDVTQEDMVTYTISVPVQIANDLVKLGEMFGDEHGSSPERVIVSAVAAYVMFAHNKRYI